MTETDRTAAEYALGLLEGEDLLAARARMAAEPEFARSVAFWEQKLAPMMDEIGAAEPSPELWQRIEAALEEDDSQTGEVVALKRRVAFWQRATAGGAIAASFALAMLALPQPGGDEPAAPNGATPLVASIPIADTPLRIGVTYLPDHSELLLTADGLEADGVHDHELWLVPPEGELRSLGLVKPGEAIRLAVDGEVAQLIGDGSQMVLTREPIGGKPVGESAGPVVAEGSFVTT